MKNTMRLLFLVTIISGLLFTACAKETEEVVPAADGNTTDVNLTIGGGADDVNTDVGVTIGGE